MSSGTPTPAQQPPVLTAYPLYRQGKVRDVYDLGDELLLVATDRLSAFDVVLPTPIPDKGVLLTRISLWWFDRLHSILPNHLAEQSLHDLDLSDAERAWLTGRSMRVHKAARVDVECVVRGSLAGSGWKEYRQSGTLAGEPLPPGLLLGSRLPAPAFTPAIKNDNGHDENISREQLREIVGAELATILEQTSLALYAEAARIASQAGFVLADTKFEFGYIEGRLSLIDEVLTPDSSRYWDAASLVPGHEPPSFDKQIVRDWLETTDWNKQAPGPEVPPDIASRAKSRYQSVLDRLTSIASPGDPQE